MTRNSGFSHPVRNPNIGRIGSLFRSWGAKKGLHASPTDYGARTLQRQTLRFSLSGDPAAEERSAVVVRLSRSRNRYERKGLLVEPATLAAVQREVAAERRSPL